MWRNRDRYVNGRAEIAAFLASKWDQELDYALRKNLWSCREASINDVRIDESHRRIFGEDRTRPLALSGPAKDPDSMLRQTAGEDARCRGCQSVRWLGRVPGRARQAVASSRLPEPHHPSC